jgi:cold shock CspA family protein
MRTTGTVKLFSTEKGYGFIKPENGKKDILSIYKHYKLQGLLV